MYLQRNYGIGKIGSMDLKETNEIHEREKRKYNKRKREETKVTCLDKDVGLPTDDCSSELSDYNDDQEEFVPQPSTSTSKPQWQMRISLKTTALTSDRYGVSGRAMAANASSVLQDIGLVTSANTSLVVDKSKVRREKHSVRTHLKSQEY